MNLKEIKEKIHNIIACKISDEELIRNFDFETPLLTLGIDSILALAILVEIEEEFDIEISDDDLNMDRIKNVDNFADLVYQYVS